MRGRQLFGVVVRTLGLVIILVGGHRVFYAFASSVLHFKSYYSPQASRRSLNWRHGNKEYG